MLRLYISLLCWVFLFFSFVSYMFMFTYWNIFIMAALKSLSDNSVISVISIVASIDCLFRSVWDLLEFGIMNDSDWILDNFALCIRLWISLFNLLNRSWDEGSSSSPWGLHWLHGDESPDSLLGLLLHRLASGASYTLTSVSALGLGFPRDLCWHDWRWRQFILWC